MNIHLITSNSFKIIKENIKKIAGENNLLIFNMEEQTIENLLEEIFYPSLEQTKKFILVKNADFLTSNKKTEINLDPLINYLNNPDENVILIFVNDSVDSRKKIVKLIKEKYNFINNELDYKNIYNYLNNYVKKHNFIIDYETINYLVSIYGLNYDLIVNELDKLFLYFENSTNIKFREAKDIVSKPLNDNNFKFVEAVINKRINEMYEYLNDLKVYKVEPITLIILLAREFRLIYYIKKLEKNNSKEIMSILGLAEWQINKLHKASFNFTEKEILKHLHTLSIMDEKIKSGKIDKNIALTTVLLNIIT